MTSWSYAKDVEMCALLVKGGRYRTLENWCETQKTVSTRKLSGRVESLHEFDKAIARRILSLTQVNKVLEAESAELRKVLAWYGDETKYDRKEVFDILVGPETPTANDGGQRARDSIGQREVKDAE